MKYLILTLLSLLILLPDSSFSSSKVENWKVNLAPKFVYPERPLSPTKCHSLCTSLIKAALVKGELDSADAEVGFGQTSKAMAKCYITCYCQKNKQNRYSNQYKAICTQEKINRHKAKRCRWYNPLTWISCLRNR